MSSEAFGPLELAVLLSHASRVDRNGEMKHLAIDLRRLDLELQHLALMNELMLE